MISMRVLLTFVRVVRIDLISARGIEYDLIWLCGWSKLTLFLNAGRKSLVLNASMQIDLRSVWVVQIDLNSVYGIELDLITV